VSKYPAPQPQPSPLPGKVGAAWTLILTSVALFMSGLDNLVVITALPTIRVRLHASIPSLEWTVNAYTLTFAVLLLTGAALGDRFGRRRILMCGIAIFAAGSLTAALAPTAGMLVAARAVQGCGAAMLLPLTLTLLTDAVPASRRAVALGIWSGVNGLAVALGPVVGGFIIQHSEWQWIFFINVPIAVVLLPLIRLRLTESRGPHNRLDIPGTTLASAGLFGIVYALVRGNTDGWTSLTVTGSGTGGVLVMVAFLAWERRQDAPMLPLRLFRSRAFAAVNLVSLLTFLGIFGSIFLLTQYLQGVQGFSPYAAGVRTLPWTAMPIAVAPVGGIIAARTGAKPVVAAGVVLMAIGLGWFALAARVGTPYSSMIIPMVMCGTGMSLYFAPLAHLVMGSAPDADKGMASGVSSAVRELGGVLGIAILSAVFTAHGSLATAQRFVAGLTPALWTGTASTAAAAVLILLLPRPTRPEAAPPAAPADARQMATTPFAAPSQTPDNAPERHPARPQLPLIVPQDPEDPANWPAWRVLAPWSLRLLAAAAAAAEPDPQEIREVLSAARRTVRYLAATGQHDAALAEAARIHDTCRRIFGASHPLTLAIRGDQAWCIGNSGDPVAALEQCAQLSAVWQQVLGPDHLSTLTAQANLAFWMTEAGHPAAPAQCADAVAAYERVLGPDDPRTVAVRDGLAF
jgi:EmrB/QacA subfamily drug resistance transporter